MKYYINSNVTNEKQLNKYKRVIDNFPYMFTPAIKKLIVEKLENYNVLNAELDKLMRTE